MRHIWLGLLAGLLWLGAAQAQPLHATSAAAGLAAQAAPTDAAPVQIGVYPTVVDDLNIGASTFDMTAYVWLRWKGDADPVKGLEFANATERQNFTQHPVFETPKILADGSKYQLLQIHGRFFQPFSLTDFPFDRQALTLVLEDELSGHRALTYVPDLKDSGLSARLDVPGWQIRGWTSAAMVEKTGSGFGLGGASQSRAGLQFTLVIARRFNFFLWKLFLPLVVVMCANWLAFLVRPEMLDVRVALTASALLTLVFLQKTYSDELPETGVLVLMDKIYAVAFLMVIATLLQVVFLGWWQKHRGLNDAAIVRGDLISMAGHVVVFAVAVSLLVGGALARG